MKQLRALLLFLDGLLVIQSDPQQMVVSFSWHFAGTHWFFGCKTHRKELEGARSEGEKRLVALLSTYL